MDCLVAVTAGSRTVGGTIRLRTGARLECLGTGGRSSDSSSEEAGCFAAPAEEGPPEADFAGGSDVPLDTVTPPDCSPDPADVWATEEVGACVTSLPLTGLGAAARFGLKISRGRSLVLATGGTVSEAMTDERAVSPVDF